jgi:DNA-binding NarL/FixJ family response regulator
VGQGESVVAGALIVTAFVESADTYQIRREKDGLAHDEAEGSVIRSLRSRSTIAAPREHQRRQDHLRPTAGTRLKLLLVDPGSQPEEATRPTTEVAAATLRRLGALPSVCAEADPESVLEAIEGCEPAAVVVVLQLEPPRRNGDTGCFRLWERAAQITKVVREARVPVIALSMGASAAALAACVEEGAVGVFHPDSLPQALHRISSGGSRCNGSDETRESGHLPPPFDALVHLTPSERRVLFHMMEGLSAADIAKTLVVSVTTVRSHIRSILRKLNVNSQLAAVALAFGTILGQTSTR